MRETELRLGLRRSMIIRSTAIMIMLAGMIQGQYRDIPDVVTKVATASANWLKIETGARALGMGGAQVAAGRGLSGIPYNPASVGFIRSSETYYSRSGYLAGITHNVLSYGTKLTGQDFLGVHLFYLDSGPMDVTTELYPDGIGEEFKVISLSLRGTYARRLTDRLKVGMSLNYIRDEIHTTTMQTFAFDIGSNFDTGIYGFVLGMSVSNFGPEVQYHGEGLQQLVPDTLDVDERMNRVTGKFPLPLVFRLGIVNDLIGSKSEFMTSEDHRLSLALDGVNPLDYTVYGNVGMEYSFREFAFLRFGTHLGHDTAGMSAGGGIRVGVPGMQISVDYAFVNYGILEVTHQFSLGLDF